MKWSLDLTTRPYCRRGWVKRRLAWEQSAWATSDFLSRFCFAQHVCAPRGLTLAPSRPEELERGTRQWSTNNVTSLLQHRRPPELS
jgi:hypothetical protein